VPSVDENSVISAVEQTRKKQQALKTSSFIAPEGALRKPMLTTCCSWS
jgi:hypothetical protein